MSLTDHSRTAGPTGPAVRLDVDTEARCLAEAVDSASWDTVAQIMEDHWPELVFGGHEEVVRQAFGQFPTGRLRSAPVLGFFAELSGRVPPGTLDLPLPEAEDHLRRIGRSPQAGSALRRSAIAIAARRSRGRHEDALELARRGRVVAEAAEWSVMTDVDHLVPLWYVHAGLAAHLAGDLTLARHLHRSAHRRRTRTPYDFVAADSAGNLAMLDAIEGNLTEAEMWVGRSDAETYSVSWVSSFVATARDVASTIIAADRLDLPALDRGLELLAGTADLDEQWPNVVWARTHGGMLRGEPMGLLSAFRRGAQAHGHRIGTTGWARDVLTLSEASLALSAGRTYQAKAALDLLEADRPAVVIGQARLALLTGDARRAGELVSTSIPMDLASSRLRAEMWLLMAEVLHAGDDHDGAADAVRQALRITTPHGSVAVYATVSRAVLDGLEPRVERLGDVLRALDTAGVGELYRPCPPMVELTPRELVVLGHLATTDTVAQIADRLCVSPNTVKSQVRSLTHKLGVSGRAECISMARQVGLLS